ncbi:MAG: S-layer homology domain-containing protein [Ruminococcaceae bacterium]|nr:S-layer homology domain-containing protein [Oscillospiraceae bacterium]
MNGMKKFIGLSLASIMAASAGTVSFAKTYDDVTIDNPAQTEISILSDIGVIKGTGENEFSPLEDVTREQMATFLFRLMLGRDDAGRVNTTKFEDLYEPYYNGAISWANAAGYIIGTSATTFNPRGGITKQDAMTMLVRALGHETSAMKAGYPWTYINAGIKLGLDKGLEEIDYEEILTREETAVILYNSLTAEYLISKTTANGNTYFESTSIIEEVFDYKMADATLVATNDYTLENRTVVKNGYVTLHCSNHSDDSFYITVPYSEMNLEGDANSYLGKSFKLIYSEDAGKHQILSAVERTSTKDFTSVKIDGDIVEIGGNEYTLVSQYSDELSTNDNELILHAYDEDGKLEIIDDVEELNDLLGFYRVTLMFDDGNDVARRGVIRVYEMNMLDISSDGKINLAANKKADEINFVNEVKAESGDYVLYYYNSSAKELEITEILEIESGIVKRITNSVVKIGDHQYKLGNDKAGISAESIKNKLTLGTNAVVVVRDEAVVAVVEGVTITNASKYLVALSDAHRIYENGSFRYVMTAFVDGEEKNIYLNGSTGTEGKVYRYTETAGEYTLIDPTVEDGIIVSGKAEFVQNSGGLDEIAYMIDSADGTSIELGGRNYYTITAGSAQAISSVAGLENVRFVCDKDTVIVVNENGLILQRTGVYNSTINVNDGAQVVAVFNNEVGSVETLKYLYISDGSLGNYDLDAEFVRVLAENGLVYEDGVAYVEYTVLNLTTGKVETKLSRHGNLVVGTDYRCGTDNTITSDTAEITVSGFVTGYTASTISVDGTTFTLASDVKVIRVNESGTTNVTIADLYMRNIEFISDRGVVTLIIESDSASFEAEYADSVITVTPDFDLENFSDSVITAVKLEKGETAVSIEGNTVTLGGENTVDITLASALEAGEYKLTFKIGTKTFTVEFEVAAPATPAE